MEALAAFEDWTRRPIDLLVVDLMFTVFVLRSKKSKRSVICNVYREKGRLSESVTDEEIQRTISEMRERFAAIKTDESYWEIVNQKVYEELIQDGRIRQHANAWARDTHKEILTSEDLYAIQPSMINMLKWVKKRGVRVVVGSNQIREYAETHLDRFGIGRGTVFDATYYSEDLEARKPHLRFWELILEQESEIMGREIDPSRVAHLGNSANSDSGAARLGIHAMLYNRYRELRNLMNGDLTGLDITDIEHSDLLNWIANGHVSVYQNIPSIRNVLKQRVKARQRG